MATLELSEHQLDALGKMHNGTILRGGVGTGKSRVALAYFFAKECGGQIPVNGKGDWGTPRAPKDVYIITTAKKRDHLDWESESAPLAISTVREKSIAGIQLTVDSWNNIQAYAEVENAFFIFDEQRLVGSGAWVKAFIKIAKKNRWIMLSATPGDNWMDFVPVFIANGFYKNRTEFIRRHVVWSRFSKFPKIERYVETRHLQQIRQRVVVDMPFERHTTRHIESIIVEYNRELYERVTKDRWHVYEDRPLRDVGELLIQARKVVNSDISRLSAILELLESHPRLIIFYSFDYELDILRSLKNSYPYPVAEWNGHKHEQLPDGDAWVYLVQYTAGAEGWNCTTTNATAFWSLQYSYKIWEQCQGRIDRLNTPYYDLHYYVLRSSAGIDRAITKSLMEKKNFNEREYARVERFVETLPMAA